MDPVLAADLIVVLHLAYVAFVVLGFLAILLGLWRGWGFARRPLFRIAHLVCTVVVPVQALLGMMCPLTIWEADLRRDAGQTTEEIGFVARLARDFLFFEASPATFTVIYVAFGLAVVLSFVLAPPRRCNRAAAGQS